MKNVLTVLFSMISFAAIIAQPLTDIPADRMLKTAEASLANNDYYNALDWFEKYYKEDRDLDVAYKVSTLHYELKDYNRAQKWFQKVVNKKSRKTANPYMPDARFDLARCMKLNGFYAEAIEEFQNYLEEGENPNLLALAKIEMEGAQMAKTMSEPDGLTVINAGKNINTKYSEYSPVFVNDNEMYFTAIRSDELLVVDGKNEGYSQAFMATKSGDEWSDPVPLSTEINREGFHIGNLSVSKDGSTMYFTRARLQGNKLAESMIFMSERGSDGWGPATKLEGVNGDFIAKQPNVGELFGNEVLYFVSNMEGGFGGFDIYYATSKGGNMYGDPINLGNTINTVGDENTPFYNDGELYFSSNGHLGIGGFDIFNSTWNGSSWSDPKNMGKVYNSSVDDLFYTIDNNGVGFLVSNREGTNSVKSKTCCDDIWEVKIQQMVLDLNALTFADGKEIEGCRIELIEVANSASDDKDPAGHKTNFVLKPETSYKLVATKDGYHPATIEFNTVGLTMSETFDKRLNLKIIPPPPPPPPKEEYETYTINEPIRLNNIYYDYNDDKILTDAERDLNTILELMGRYPDMVIELSSHTDSRGNDSYNQSLSLRRATSAKSWLLNKGVAAERIQAVGYGETNILNECVNGKVCSDEEHRYNRRTEFKIVSGPTTITINKKRLKKN